MGMTVLLAVVGIDRTDGANGSRAADRAGRKQGDGRCEGEQVGDQWDLRSAWQPPVKMSHGWSEIPPRELM
jgi:hypothetical protein